MIRSRVTSDFRTTVPLVVRQMIGLQPGDDVRWEIKSNSVVVTRASSMPVSSIGLSAVFTEWSTEADSKAFDHS